MTTITCTSHPTGDTDLDTSLFYESDHGKKFGTCKECRKRKAKELRIKRRNTPDTPQPVFVSISDEPISTVPTMPANEQATTALSGTLDQFPKSMQRIGGYYISETTVLLADVTNAGRVVVHTSLLEIDRETKTPRNKRLLFTQQNDPIEYKTMLAWLDTLAGTPIEIVNAANETAALQLAAEMEIKLNAANTKIAQLEAALAPLRALMNANGKG